MKNKEYRGVIGWTALLLLFFMQVSYGQGTGDFTVSGGTYSFADNVLTVSEGEVTVSTTKETPHTIKLTGGKLILNGVTIKVTSGVVSPIEVEGAAEINLADGSANTLTSTTVKAAGIHVPLGKQVTFTGNGTLTAENTIRDGSDYSSSGIGGNAGTYSCGTIIFNLTGTVMANGGLFAAGIGTSSHFNASVSGSILIKRGTINATGGRHAAGIGTGPDVKIGGGVTVMIEGGTVTAMGGENSSGIGSGRNCKTPVDIFLLGGTVTADVAPGTSASSLNTVIVGPDVIITESNTVTDNYTNGFVFTGNPKEATVKGNSAFPADKEITVNADEKLTVPEGMTLTNNGTIINNGTICNDGTIIDNGTITGTGEILYKVSYDTNSGSGTLPDAVYAPVGTFTLPEYSGLFREGYTCLGWNTTNSATTALKSYAVVAGANKLYAVWALNIELSSDSKAITGKVGETFGGVDLSTNVLNKDVVGDVTFAVNGDNSLPKGFSLAEDGILVGPDPLATAMSNVTVTVTVTPKNGAPAKEFTLTFNIDKKVLVVTPNPGQFVYADEVDEYAPTYTFSEALVGQVPAFSKKLGWAYGTGEWNITLSTLTLTDNSSFKADNYQLELSSSLVTINVYQGTLVDAYATDAIEIAAEVTPGWHKSPITLTAPADFKLKAITDLRTASGWENTLVISKDGEYAFKYQLLRNGRGESSASAEQTLSIQLDQTAPAIKGDPVVSNLTATFTLSDAVSGIASYSYTLDGGTLVSVASVADNPHELPVVVSAAAGPHTIAFTIKDAAGNEATTAPVSFTLTNPTPPVTPPEEVDPTCYTVTLPAVEGATTDPVAGSYEVESWDNFRFYLTLDEAYNLSEPIVRTDRGETIRPRSSDGAYIVKSVRSDIEIFIDGVEKNPDPVGNVEVDPNTYLRVAGGCLQITVPQTADAFITDTSGRILRTLRLVPGTTRVEGLHAGIYIVKIAGQEGRKVIIN